MRLLQKILFGVGWFGRVSANAAFRFYWDDCFSRAAALAYTSLFSLVPVTALSFSMFSVFGLDREQFALLLQTVLEQVLPPIQNHQLRELHEQVLGHFQSFTENVRALNTVSIGVLLLTSIALLNTIESALNVVWRVSSNLSIFSKLINFWAVLTLGPLLITLSIVYTTRVRSWQISEELSGVYGFGISYAVPITVTWLALTLLFYKLPAARVRLVDALLGALISSVLFEFIKRAFAYYISLSTTYSTVYGVLASIPLFLFWLYVTWAVILYGAELSYQSGSHHILRGLKRYKTQLGEVGGLLGLRILLIIVRNFREGKIPPTEGDLAIEAGADPVLVRESLNVLSQANIISGPDERTHARSLLINPERVTVGEVLDTFWSKEHGQVLGNHVVPQETLLETFRRVPGDAPLREWPLSDLVFWWSAVNTVEEFGEKHSEN